MLSFRIALRYLRAKKSHRSVNVITAIAVTGVAVATMAMVLLLSIFNGFTDLALSQLSHLDPDLSVVSADGRPLAPADSLAAVVATVPGVEGATPAVTEKALLVDGDRRVAVTMKGLRSDSRAAAGMDSIVIAGQYATATTDGRDAVQLSVGVANSVTSYPSPDADMQLYVPRRSGRINPANPMAAFRTVPVVFSGVFRVNNADVDGDNIVVPLEVAQRLLDYDDQATSISVDVTAGAHPGDVKKLVESRLGPRYRVLERLEQRADSFRMISVEKWVTFMMLLCILVIALFNVVSTLSLLAIEKRDNMATLRALGATPAMTRNVFIAEGFLVTGIGGLIGIALGVVLALGQQFFHLVRLNADTASLTIDYYPVRVEATDLLAVAAVVLVLALVVSLLTRITTRLR